MRPITLAASFSLLLLATPVAALSLQPIEQQRHVAAETQWRDALSEDPILYGASDRVDASGFGPFDALVAPTCSGTLFCPPVSASQTSVIDSLGFTVSVSTHAEALFAHEGLQTGSSRAVSVFVLSFNIPQPTDFEIVSVIDEASYTDGQMNFAEWTLVQLGNPSFWLEGFCCGEQTFHGTLAPGGYSIHVSVGSEAIFTDYPSGAQTFEASSVALSFRLIPEPGTGLLLLIGISGIALGVRRGA